jgi:hypothetical protein
LETLGPWVSWWFRCCALYLPAFGPCLHVIILYIYTIYICVYYIYIRYVYIYILYTYRHIQFDVWLFEVFACKCRYRYSIHGESGLFSHIYFLSPLNVSMSDQLAHVPSFWSCSIIFHDWLVVSHICYFPFSIWDVILPIDELHHGSRWLLHHQPDDVASVSSALVPFFGVAKQHVSQHLVTWMLWKAPVLWRFVTKKLDVPDLRFKTRDWQPANSGWRLW